DEPMMAEFDRPDALASGIELPSNLNSNLLHVDPILPLGPSMPGGGGIAGGPGGNVPPPIGGGGVIPPAGGNCPPKSTAKDCQHPQPPPPPPPPPPPAVPEPSTMVLAISGAVAVLARFRLAGKKRPAELRGALPIKKLQPILRESRPDFFPRNFPPQKKNPMG